VSNQASGSRFRYALLLGLSLVLVAGGIGMMVTGADGGVATTAFFGVCAAVSVWHMRPGLLESEIRSADTVLAHYPGPVVLRASVKKILFLATLSAVFGGVMLWMLMHEAPSVTMQVLLWPGVVLFLGGLPVLILVAIRGSSLHLDGTGLTIVQAGRSRRMSWHDVSGFAAVTVKGTMQRMVVFDDARVGEGRLVALNRQLTGRGAGLPDSYGLDPDALAALLTAWRRRAVQDEPIGPSGVSAGDRPRASEPAP
jgi:hypothetical protein